MQVTNTEIVKLSKEGYLFMCSHVYDYAHMLAQLMSDTETGSKLIVYATFFELIKQILIHNTFSNCSLVVALYKA